MTVVCDYCWEGIWDRNGVSFGHKAFPVSEALNARLMAWQAVYDGWFYPIIEAEDRGEVLDVDWEGFSRIGHDIAIDIKRELPDWTVFYVDKYLLKTERFQIGVRQPDPRYEITADML